MKDSILYRNLAIIVVLLLCMGCEEFMYKEEAYPSLHPRYLSVDKIEVVAPSANVYSTTLSVSSENTPWSINGYPSWLSITPNHGETDTNASVNFIENLSADTSRYALFFLTDEVEDWDYGRAITASQPAATPYLRLSSDDIETSGAANQYQIEVYTNASWNIRHSCSWISVESGGTSLTINVQANSSGDYRDAYIYVVAANCTETLHITQAPANATATEDDLHFTNQAASAKFTITSEVAWEATVTASWLQISPDNGVAGTTEVTVDVAPNLSLSERKGYIVFKCSNAAPSLLIMKIVQDGLFLETGEEELVFDAQECNRDLQINSNTEWVITSAPKWATPTVSKGSNNASISIRAEENTSTYERSGFLELESPGLSLSAKVLLTQKGKSFNLGTTLLEFSDKASTNTVDIITDGTWQALCDATWLTLSPHSANGNSTLAVSVTENTDDSERMAIIMVTMSDKSIELIVRQQGKFLSVGEAQLLFPTKGGVINLHVATNDTWAAFLRDNAEWLSLSTTQGEGIVDMVISATDNASVNERTDVLNITTKNNLNLQLPIKQEARRLSVSVSDILFFSRGGTSERVTIDTNGEYKISQVGDWFAISRMENIFTVTALANNTKGWREGSITISLTDLVEGSYEITIPVIQVQAGCSFTLSGFGDDTNQNISQGGGNLTGNGFGIDLDWNASIGNVFTVSLIDFVADSNWDTMGSNAFTVTITGYRDENNWNTNDSSNTTFGKDNFGSDINQNNNDSTNTILGKDNYGNDTNHDTNDSTNTNIGKDDYGGDTNQDNNDSTDTNIGKNGFEPDHNWNE